MKFSSPKLDIFVKNFAPIGECVFFFLSCSNFLIFSTLSLWSIQGSWYITRRFNEKNDEKFAANDQSCGREISRNDWNGKYSKKCLLWTILFLLLTDLWHINQFLISSTLRWIFLVRVRDNVHSKSFTNFTSKKSTKKFSKKKNSCANIYRKNGHGEGWEGWGEMSIFFFLCCSPLSYFLQREMISFLWIGVSTLYSFFLSSSPSYKGSATRKKSCDDDRQRNARCHCFTVASTVWIWRRCPALSGGDFITQW